MQEAIDALQFRQLMGEVKSKLIVIYEGEVGIDSGGVRWDYFSNSFH